MFLVNMLVFFLWKIKKVNKEEMIITNAFQNILDKSKRKSNKIWVDEVNEVSEFHNRSIKLWLKTNY